MAALSVNTLEVEEKILHQPSLIEMRNILKNTLTANFQEVLVEVVDCPDLKQPPYNLVDSYLGGSQTLIEIGGPTYLLPKPNLTKVYDFKEISQKIFGNDRNIFMIGAGAGPFMLRHMNCEGMYNMKIDNKGKFTNGSYTARVGNSNENCILEKIPDSETCGALLLNLYACESKPGKVLKVHCKQRIGELNFIESIRLELQKHYGDQCVALGGMFLMKNGAAKQHVMRDFAKYEINSDEQLNEWLKFYEMPAVLNAVGVLITQETELDCRLQHFHSFSNSNWGGHYHYDVTPDTVEYEGYFNVIEKVVRIDKPKNAHKFGRD